MTQLNWRWDELTLACELLAKNEWRELRRTDPAIGELSALLQRFPIHPLSDRDTDFRSPGSVRRKLSNLATIHPGYSGKRTRGSKMDQAVLDAFLKSPDEMVASAEALREADRAGSIQQLPVPRQEEPDELEVPEGRLLLRLHMRRDRDPRARAARIKMAGDDLQCEVCEFDFGGTYGPRGAGYIECHHVVPLHISGETRTKAKDLALLCSNCHRMIHRSRDWLTPNELREIVQARSIVSED